MNSLPEKFSFWGCASFEKRTAQVFAFLKSNNHLPIKNNIFFNSEKPFDGFQNIFSLNDVEQNFIPLKYSDPIYSADKFIECLDGNIASGITNFVVDITTFTREWLLMMLAIFKLQRYSHCKVTCGYNRAQSMSTSWLSRGPLEMRTVLGYSGSFFSSKKTHLYLILGHEVERAVAIIDSTEPALLTIVTGSKDGSVTEEMHKINIAFKEYIKNCYSIDTIEADIDIVDFEKSKNGILESLSLDKDFNTVIAPLNTKISTVAAGVISLEHPKIQVCYLPMEQYNADGFSIPSEVNSFFELSLH